MATFSQHLLPLLTLPSLLAIQVRSDFQPQELARDPNRQQHNPSPWGRPLRGAQANALIPVPFNELPIFFRSAGGGLKHTSEHLMRLRNLAMKAKQGTRNSIQRANLDLQYQAFKAVFNQISTAAQFDGKPLHDGTLDALLHGAPDTSPVVLDLPDLRTSSLLGIFHASSNLTTVTSAFAAVMQIDGALNQVSDARSELLATLDQLAPRANSQKRAPGNLEVPSDKLGVFHSHVLPAYVQFEDSAARLQEMALESARNTTGDPRRLELQLEAQATLNNIENAATQLSLDGFVLFDGHADANLHDEQGFIQSYTLDLPNNRVSSLGLDIFDISTRSGAYQGLNRIDSALDQLATSRVQLQIAGHILAL